MGAAAGVGGGLGIMGGVLGGIGDIMSATKYKPPKLPEPGGQEKRLRSIAQGQLIGGGQEALAGQQLYNQMTPLLMSMLPGMSVTPRTAGGGAGAAGGTAGPSTTPGMQTYQDALKNYQDAIGRNERLLQVKAQLKATKKGPDKKALKAEQKALKKAQKGAPTLPELERAMYNAGSAPPVMNVQMGDESGGAAQPKALGSGMSPSATSTLAQIMGYLHGSQGGGGGGGTTPQASFTPSASSSLTDVNNAMTGSSVQPYGPAGGPG